MDGGRWLAFGSVTVLVYRMTLIPMQAIRDFSWNGRTVRRGEYLEVTGAESLALRFASKAKFTKSSGGTYQVAAMTPESSGQATASDPEPTAQTAPPSRRRYRRRDLEAETHE